MEPLAARAAIADLIHTYARNVRAGRGADCVQLFTADAVFEVREVSLGGSDAVRTRSKIAGHEELSHYLVRATGESRVCPLIHNLLIEVDGHEAVSNCVMTSLVWPSGQQLMGEYQDSFRFETGTDWRFSSRVFTIFNDLPIRQR
jgi:hypothetical protein